jgi:hypothetical protein
VQKYRLLGLLVLVAGIALACLAITHLFSHPRFTKEKFDQIHVGMTEAEVVAELGKPAGNYTGCPVVIKIDYPMGFKGHMRIMTDDASVSKEWMSDVGWVGVCFSSDGKVVSCYWEEISIKEPPSLLEYARWMVLRSLGLERFDVLLLECREVPADATARRRPAETRRPLPARPG